MNSNIEAANYIRDQRIIPKTKKSYISKLNVLKTFVLEKGYGGRMIDRENNLVIHNASTEDQKEVFIAFFGWLATKTDIPRGRHEEDNDGQEDLGRRDRFARNSKTIAISSISQYKSAIVWYFQENQTVLDKGVDNVLKETLKGYKKLLLKKSNGIMDVEEGKTKLSFTGHVELSRYMMRLKPEPKHILGGNFWLELSSFPMEPNVSKHKC